MMTQAKFPEQPQTSPKMTQYTLLFPQNSLFAFVFVMSFAPSQIRIVLIEQFQCSSCTHYVMLLLNHRCRLARLLESKNWLEPKTRTNQPTLSAAALTHSWTAERQALQKSNGKKQKQNMKKKKKKKKNKHLSQAYGFDLGVVADHLPKNRTRCYSCLCFRLQFEIPLRHWYCYDSSWPTGCLASWMLVLS